MKLGQHLHTCIRITKVRSVRVAIEKRGIGAAEDISYLLVQPRRRDEGRYWSGITTASMEDGRLGVAR